MVEQPMRRQSSVWPLVLSVLALNGLLVGVAQAQWTSTSGLQSTPNRVAIGTSSAVDSQTAISVNTDLYNAMRIISTGSREQTLLVFAHINTATWVIGPGFVTGNHDFALYDVNSGKVVWAVDANDNLGVGTTTPTARLDVSGAVHVSQELRVDGNIAAKYQDVAEWVPGSGDLTPGTVVVIDTRFANHVTASSRSYDTHVAGVISPQPGLALGTGGAGKYQVATVGRVRVMADATRGPIAIGDLLVTSDLSGVAMRSDPVTIGGIDLHRPGTLLGKALEPLSGGRGEILVLLSLQ